MKSPIEIKEEAARRRRRNRPARTMTPQPSRDAQNDTAHAAVVRELELEVLAKEGRKKLLAKSAAEGRNDYGRLALAPPRPYPSRTKAELKGGQGPGTVGRLVETFVEQPLEDAVWALEHPVDRITGKGRAADGVMMWPGGGRVPKFKPGTLAPARDLERLADGTYQMRSVRLGENVTQFPASQSRLTRNVFQRPADALSEKLTGPVNRLRDSDSPIARAAGKTLTLPSARRRVPVQAGKHVRREGLRAKALRADDIRAIKAVGGRSSRLPGRELKGKQVANFWYAQLPKSYRNVDGLTLVRGKLAEEQERLTSGAFSQSLKAETNALRADARQARLDGDDQAVFVTLNKVKELKRLEADLPERIRDVGENLAKLDQVIAKPVKVNERAIEGLGKLAEDTRAIYVAAGKLKPDVADERTGLVSRWLGLEPTGEEIFVGHRQGRVKGSRPSGMPGGISTGKTSAPAGIAKQNRLVLVKSGRVRQDLVSAVEDWQRAQSYQFTNRMKDELGQMGEPVIGRPKPGYIVVNPRGHELPRTWKTDDDAQTLAEGLDPDEIHVGDVNEYVRNVMAKEPDEITEMLRKAEEAGHLADLRQVPADVVSRYAAQFMPARITVATPGIKEGASMLSKAGNTANDLLSLSLIYANPGYIPSQIVANSTMAIAHQGAFFPSNFARATQVMTTGPRKLRDLLHVEHGQGASEAVAHTVRVRSVTKPIHAVADNAFRLSAVIHEAARLGVIPKKSAHLSDADYAALEQFATDPRLRAALNDASDRATQSMVDFDRLGAKEAAVSRAGFFVWRWIRGGSRYPLRFAADHPIRTAGIGGAAYLGEDQIRDATADDLPPWLAGTLDLGEKVVDGETYPRILPTRSFSPISTPLETLGTLTAQPGARPIGEILNPGGMSVLNTGLRRNSYGGKEDSYWDSIKANAERLAPTVNFVGEVVNPPDDPGLYPGDATRRGRIERQLRVIPYAVDPEEAKKRRPKDPVRDFKEDAEAAGLKPPPSAIRQVELKAKMSEDKRMKRGAPNIDEATALAEMYARLTGDRKTLDAVKRLEPEDEDGAQWYVTMLSEELFGEMHWYELQADKILEP